MLSHDKWTNKSIPELSGSMKMKVARRQQNLGLNLKLRMSSVSISVFLLILLRLKQHFNSKLLYAFPMFYLVLRCLRRMHAIQAINQHL